MIQNAENDDTNDEECIDNDTNDEECIDNDTNDEGYVNDNDSESGPQNIPVLNKKQYNDIANHISNVGGKVGSLFPYLPHVKSGAKSFSKNGNPLVDFSHISDDTLQIIRDWIISLKIDGGNYAIVLVESTGDICLCRRQDVKMTSDGKSKWDDPENITNRDKSEVPPLTFFKKIPDENILVFDQDAQNNAMRNGHMITWRPVKGDQIDPDGAALHGCYVDTKGNFFIKVIVPKLLEENLSCDNNQVIRWMPVECFRDHLKNLANGKNSLVTLEMVSTIGSQSIPARVYLQDHMNCNDPCCSKKSTKCKKNFNCGACTVFAPHGMVCLEIPRNIPAILKFLETNNLEGIIFTNPDNKKELRKLTKEHLGCTPSHNDPKLPSWYNPDKKSLFTLDVNDLLDIANF